MPEKDFQIKFSARDDGTYGRVIKQTVDGLSAIKGTAAGMASALTGGLIGGGVIGVFTALLDRIGAARRELKELKRTADDLNVHPDIVSGYRDLEGGLGAPGRLTGAVKAATLRRADALAGDPEAIADFEKIGVTLKQIKDLEPDQLFLRIAYAFRSFDPKATGSRERFFAANSALGGNAEFWMPYFMGRLFESDPYVQAMGRSGGFLGKVSDPEYYQSYKMELAPFSSYGIDTQRRANKLGEENRNRAIDMARAQLPAEEQLNRLLAERVALEREISAATSPLRREQLVSRLLDLNGNIQGLDQQQRALAAKNLPTGAAYPRSLDELSRSGFFTGGPPSPLLDINRQQLRELQKTVDLLRVLPKSLGNEI